MYVVTSQLVTVDEAGYPYKVKAKLQVTGTFPEPYSNEASAAKQRAASHHTLSTQS